MMGEKVRRKSRSSQSAVFGKGPGSEFDLRTLHSNEAGAFRGFRRDAKDRAVAREAVTGLLLGDPPPGKFNHQPLWDPEAGTVRTAAPWLTARQRAARQETT